MPDPLESIESLFRAKSGEVQARLLREFGVERFSLVEEAVQTAFQRALERWPPAGEPANPGGWIFTVARNAVLESLRRKGAEERKADRFARETPEHGAPAALEDVRAAEDALDDLAEMVLLCCNPDLSDRAQVCITLKAACGLSTAEIARLLGMEQEAAKKTITRARERIAASPDAFGALRGERISSRFRAVLETIYAVFTEGYAATRGDASLRKDVAEQAVRLAEALSSSTLVPDERRGELEALMALMLLQLARFAARIDASGLAVRLEDQDRTRWNPAMIAGGLRALERSTTATRVSVYHLEARIAAEHSTSASFAATRWSVILELYDQLLKLKDTPMVRLNRVVAVRYVRGPGAALEELEGPAPERHLASSPGASLRHAIRAEALEALGLHDEAAVAWAAAVAAAVTVTDRESLRRRAGRQAADVPVREGGASTGQEATP